MRHQDFHLQRPKAEDWPHDIRRQIEIDAAGLVFGVGTLLARMTASGRTVIETDRDRILTLLSVAHGSPVSPDVLVPLTAACAHWQRGDKVLANLRLVFGRLPRLGEPADAYRMRLAEYLLDEGLSPLALMKELGLDPSHLDLAKYDPDQPRVPAGNGEQSGRWGSLALVSTIIGRSFLAGASSAAVVALGSLAARLAGPIAFLLSMVIPTPNNGGVTKGTLPGEPQVAFAKDGQAGTLRLTTKARDGSDVAVEAESRNGLYVDIRSGQAIGRDYGARIYLDSDAIHAAINDQLTHEGRVELYPQPTDEDKPKLCPEPSDDVPNNPSDRAKAYQEQISLLNNPLRALKWGEAVSLNNPVTGKRVVYDDCRERDGTMIEAKGPGFAKNLKYQVMLDSYQEDWERQARDQVNASGGRDIEWFFAENAAAKTARDIFDANDNLRRIRVFMVPAVMQ